jgi:PA14 domain
MQTFLKHLSYTTRRYTAAIALAAAFISCAQTPTAPSTIETTDETGAVATTQAIPVNGLKGDYYDNIDFTGTLKTRYDATINSNWKTAAPITGIAATTYSVRWTGQIQPAFTEEYTFSLTSSGQARLMINGVVLVNNWVEHASKVDTGKVSLQANTKYDIRLEYARNAVQGALVKLEWQSARRTKQVVPNAALFSSGSNLEKGLNDLEQYLSTQSTNVVLDRNDAGLVLAQNGYTIMVREKNKTGVVLAAQVDGAFRLAVKLTSENQNLIGTNLLTGESVNLGATSQYYSSTGVQTPAQLAVIRQKLAPILTLNRLTFKTITTARTGATTQGIEQCWEPLPPECPGCEVAANDYLLAECEVYTPVTAAVAGGTGAVIGAIATGGTAVGAAIGGAAGFVAGGIADLIKLPGNLRNRDLMKRIYDICRKDNLCGPVLVVSPAELNLRARVNQDASGSVTISNAASLPVTVRKTMNFSHNGAVEGLEIPAGWLESQKSTNIRFVRKCPSTPQVLTDSVKIWHDAPNVSSPYIVPVKITCYAEPKILVTPQNLSFVAPLNKSTEPQKITVKNIGDADLTIRSATFTETSNTATGSTVNGSGNFSSLLTPNQESSIDVTGTCGSTVGTLQGTITISSNDPSSPTTVGVTLECVESLVQATNFSPMLASFELWSGIQKQSFRVYNYSNSALPYFANDDGPLKVVSGKEGSIPARGYVTIEIQLDCQYSVTDFFPSIFAQAQRRDILIRAGINGSILASSRNAAQCIGPSFAGYVVDYESQGSDSTGYWYATAGGSYIDGAGDRQNNYGINGEFRTRIDQRNAAKGALDSKIGVPSLPWMEQCMKSLYPGLFNPDIDYPPCKLETWESAKSRALKIFGL